MSHPPRNSPNPSFLTALAPDWAHALAPVLPRIQQIEADLQATGSRFLPAPDVVLRAFSQPLELVRVLIVGQDPYPTPGHATGLAFSTRADVRPLPRSLTNIFTELHDDVGIPTPASGDLTPWTHQGVLLLNRVLTVDPGAPGSHHGRGWEEITEHAIRALLEHGGPLVAILWGAQARSLRPLLGRTPVIESAHPSPLSARRGFFGSRPFSRTNTHLEQLGAEPVDWSLDTQLGQQWLL